ncbi:MAG: D-amino acid aminotransferase [Ruminococcaceae bacterium]|nr:D-amino acid aminotransferase [Oscillospiraceae bacterium]
MRIGYFNKRIAPLEELSIPLTDRSVFFGDAVYDAVLVINKKPYTLELHLDRLYQSCRLINIEFDMSRELLTNEISRLLDKSDMGSILLYIQVTRGAAPRKHEFPENTKPNLLMFTSPITLCPKDKKASLMTVEDQRFYYCNIKTTNLLPNVIAAQNATANGYTEVLMHRNKRVTEAAHSSILITKNGRLVAPPLDNLILPGITRAILIDLCQKNSIPVDIRPFTLDEAWDADEILLLSTTKLLLRVQEIDRKPAGGKDPEFAQRLRKLMDDDLFERIGEKL